MGDEVKSYPVRIGGKELIYPNVHAGAGKYSAAVVVGNLVFLSGMTAQSEVDGSCLQGTIEEQVRICLDRVRAHLEEAGSAMENIVKTLILLKDIEYYQRMRATELAYYQEHAPRLVREPPASTILQPAMMGRPEYLVEFDVTAVLDRGAA